MAAARLPRYAATSRGEKQQVFAVLLCKYKGKHMSTLKKGLFAALFMAAGLILASNAWAQEFEGQSEVAIALNMNTTTPGEGDSTSTLFMNFSYASFISDTAQIGFYTNILTAGTSDDTFGAIIFGGLARFYVFDETAEKAFYIGPHFGIMTVYAADLVGNGTALGGFAGGKFFLSESQAVFVEYRITQTEMTFEDDFGNTFDTSLSASDLSIGFSYFFGG